MKTLELLLYVDDFRLNLPMLLNPETVEKGYFLPPIFIQLKVYSPRKKLYPFVTFCNPFEKANLKTSAV